MRMKGKKVYFSYRDTFSLDNTLSPVILSALKRFKEVITDPKHADWRGVPGMVLCEMFPDLEGHANEEQMAQADARWLEIIDTMIYAFDHKNEPNLKDYNFKFHHRVLEEYEDGSSRITIDHDNEAEYQRFRADEKAWQAKVEEGLSLFSRYYQCLWW